MTEKRRNFVWGLAKDWGVALVLIGAVVAAWLFFSSSGPGVGEPAPDFTLPSTGGEEITLSDYRGETVVLNFWATWCGPCVREIPDLASFQDHNPDVTLIGVSVDDQLGPAGVRAKAERFGADYMVLLDPTGTASSPYSVHTLPTTVVIGPDGTVIDSQIGTVSERQLERMTQL